MIHAPDVDEGWFGDRMSALVRPSPRVQALRERLRRVHDSLAFELASSGSDWVAPHDGPPAGRGSGHWRPARWRSASSWFVPVIGTAAFFERA